MRPVNKWNPEIAFRAALPLLVVSLSSCAPLGNFLWNGHWEDPNAEEPMPAPLAKEEPAPEPVPEKTASQQVAIPVEKPKPRELLVDTVFTRGSWFFLRTSGALYSWTGAGEQFRLFAFELSHDANCWGSQRGNRPVAEHCPNMDGPPAPTGRTVNGQPVQNVLFGIEKAPWKEARTGAPLNDGTYDLPAAAGEGRGAFTLECNGDKITIRTPSTAQGLAFTVQSASADFLVQGEAPDLFDGCTDANGIIAVSDEVGVRLGKKRCGIVRHELAGGPSLIVDKVTLEFSTTSKAPDIADARIKSAKLRKTAVEHKAQLALDISGDATHTLMSATMKRADGEEASMVEGVRTLDGIHHKCESKITRIDTTWLKTAKQVCGAMVQMK
jgi:hypothetical protein